MNELPKKIISIKGAQGSGGEAYARKNIYTLNEGTRKEKIISIEKPLLSRKKSFDIIDDTRDFVNGFKVVQTANKEYAYVREDNFLLPYRYDIATDFNEYGYAMVGKDGSVSWINRNFRYFDVTKEKFLEEENVSFAFNDIRSINDFGKGKYPLSKMVYKKVLHYYEEETVYLGVDGKIKQFSKYDGEKISENNSMKEFSEQSTNFNNKGYATANAGSLILLSSGHYLTVKDLIRICEEKGFLDAINSRVEKQEQEYYKFLKNVKEKTTTVADDLSQHNNLIAEYGIGSIELKKEKLISSYGKDVYERALTNGSLVCLIVNEEIPAEIVDLELFQSALAKRGIPSYIDNEENVFHYNANKHVKTKKVIS